MNKLTEYVKTAEAAEILGVAQNTLRKWAERGDIPMRRTVASTEFVGDVVRHRERWIWRKLKPIG